MRQRVMIAMAMANQPDVIIADEPTTALDVTIQAQILDVLKTAKEVTGAAIVLITHDLGVVAGFADRVAVMYAGASSKLATSTMCSIGRGCLTHWDCWDRFRGSTSDAGSASRQSTETRHRSCTCRPDAHSGRDARCESRSVCSWSPHCCRSRDTIPRTAQRATAATRSNSRR